MFDGTAKETATHDYTPAIETMRDDVLRGLAQNPKVLPSQYLYDERGARLFERICDTEEYYLTRTEIAILRNNMDAITRRIGPGALVIEPGSGSGIKTRLLLEGLHNPVAYVPIDVAKEQLVAFAARIERDFPNLEVLPVCADFTTDYQLPACRSPIQTSLTYFPGSTIGNFTPTAAIEVLRHTAELCGIHGAVLIGVDLEKDPAILEPAYDDAAGVSHAFALNYLERMNRELDADFKIDRFGYEAPYNQSKGRIEMALVSLKRQVVRISGVPVTFEENERVSTEYSYKYSLEGFADIARSAGLQVAEVWTDPKRLFSVQYLAHA
ncbi:MAG: L-histidine N(alpha)-methyltransferase [Phycisphaerae bacterium]|jgi:dimethylhistidine N-methyltransferase